MNEHIPLLEGQKQNGVNAKTVRLFTKSQWLLVLQILVANFSSCATFSCVVPFFPLEAKRKGLGTGTVGFIIGAFQMVVFAASPIYGKYMEKIKPMRMFICGLLFCSLGTIFYGFLTYFQSPFSFFVAAFLFRCVTAAGNAAFRTASMTLIATYFPAQISTVMGLSSTALSLGYIVGPSVGSLFYELGGFALPFFVLGSLVFASALLAIYIFRRHSSEFGSNYRNLSTSDQSRNVENDLLFKMLRLPQILVTLTAVFSLEVTLFFYDASIADHVSTLTSRASFLTGLMLSLCALLATISGPVWGIIVDHFGIFRPIMAAGTLMALIFPLLLGPSPLLAPILSLSIPSAAVAFAIQGIAITAISTPSYKFCIEGAKRHGYDASDTGICGAISGLLNGVTALGALLSVVLGGWSVQWIGFEWTGTIAGLMNLMPLTAQMVLFWHERAN